MFQVSQFVKYGVRKHQRENKVTQMRVPQFAFVETWHTLQPHLTYLQYLFATRTKATATLNTAAS